MCSDRLAHGARELTSANPHARPRVALVAHAVETLGGHAGVVAPPTLIFDVRRLTSDTGRAVPLTDERVRELRNWLTDWLLTEPTGCVRWTEDSVRSLIGQTPRLNAREFDGGPITDDYGNGTVVDAVIVDDGATVELTISTEQRIEPLERSSGPHMSIGFNP